MSESAKSWRKFYKNVESALKNVWMWHRIRNETLAASRLHQVVMVKLSPEHKLQKWNWNNLFLFQTTQRNKNIFFPCLHSTFPFSLRKSLVHLYLPLAVADSDWDNNGGEPCSTLPLLLGEQGRLPQQQTVMSAWTEYQELNWIMQSDSKFFQPAVTYGERRDNKIWIREMCRSAY